MKPTRPIVAEEFISEPIQPVLPSMDAASAAAGEPAFPGKFIWRGEEITVLGILEKWKESGPCTHGSAERYLRKHWYRVKTDGGREMRIYFQRQKRGAAKHKDRWILYGISNTD